MFVILSNEEAVALRRDLVGEISGALLDLEPGGHPRNFTLYNALLRVFEVWEAGEEARDEAWAAAVEKSCGCL